VLSTLRNSSLLRDARRRVVLTFPASRAEECKRVVCAEPCPDAAQAIVEARAESSFALLR
jgi:hypothetical protein